MRQKELIELSITAVLLVVMIFVFGNAAKKSRLRNIKIIQPQTVNSTQKVLIQENKIDSKNLYTVLEEEAKSFELKRDPFTAAAIISDKNMKSGVLLSGIIWDKASPMAIIDGNIVKVGQRLGNETVMEIRRDRVILSDGENLVEIKLQR